MPLPSGARTMLAGKARFVGALNATSTAPVVALYLFTRPANPAVAYRSLPITNRFPAPLSVGLGAMKSDIDDRLRWT